MAAPVWKQLQCKISEIRLDKTLICGQSFRWKEQEKGEWIGVFSNRVWRLKQTSEEILYQVWGKKVDHLTVPVKTEPLLEKTPTFAQKQKGKGKKRQIKTSSANCETLQELDKKPTVTEQIDTKINGLVHHCENSYMDDADLRDYFQLNVSLSDLYKTWAQVDSNFEIISKQFEGVRILRQEPVECLFAFICSSNNNIARITSMVEKLALHYGEKIAEVDGIPYYSFPAASALAVDGVEEKLRSLGFGYRAKYIQQSARYIEEKGGEDWLYSLRHKDYKEAKIELMKLCGVGAKVADCVGLFCLDKAGSIPVDTHVWQIAARDYMPKLKQAKSLTDKLYEEIGDYFRNLWGPYAGWAHSVLFAADLRRFKEDAEKAKLSSGKRKNSSEDIKPKPKVKRKKKIRQ